VDILKPDEIAERRAKLFRAAASTMVPTSVELPDEWAAKNRVYPAGSGIPGPRDPWLTAYGVHFARALANQFGDGRTYKRVAIVMSSQSGKTESYLDTIGERLDNRPAPIIFVGPSLQFVTEQFEPRLVEMFAQSTSLSSKVLGGLDSKRQKKTLKRVAGTRVRLAHAGSSTALKSDSFALALIDELDELKASVRDQGDPVELVEARLSTYADGMLGVTSTPSLGIVGTEVDPTTGLEFWVRGSAEEISSPIWKLFQSGTRHHWAWRCPHCREFFVPRSSLLRFDPKAPPAEVARDAYVACPHCGGVIEEHHKRDMNLNGRFVAPGQRVTPDGDVVGNAEDNTTLSLWVSGLASPFKTFGDRASAVAAAVQTGEAAKIQAAYNAALGECYAPRGGDLPTWEELKARAMPYALGTVPDAAKFLTCGVDIQADRVYFVVRGWGPKATSWLVQHGALFGDTSDVQVWEELAELLRSPVGSTERLIKLVFLDSGFRPGKPFQVPVNRVYEFCREHRRFIFPTKGSSNPLTRPLVQSKIEVNRKGTAEKYGLDMFRLDTDHWKSFVHERLSWNPEIPGAWFTSHEASDDYFKQVVAETRVIQDGKPKWLQLHRDNHYLDCEAMAAAAAYLLNAQYLRAPEPERAEPDTENATEAVTLLDNATETCQKGNSAAPKAVPRETFAALAARLNR
jgi:phage terminase large subunit GpA-like protein